MKRSQLVLFLLTLVSVSTFAETSREFLTSKDGKKTEFYISKPEGIGPFPVLILIHPDQDSPKTGGQIFAEMGQLELWTKKGYLTVAPSQPGYGESEGPPDFCGPRTVEAATEVLNAIRARKDVNPERIFIYGGSRGAVVAAQIATQDQKVRGFILKSGVYDMVQWKDEVPWYSPVKFSMIWEIGWPSAEKLRERSASEHAGQVKASVLIIHGTKDDRAPISTAEKFNAQINQSGGHSRLLKIESEHVIPMSQINGAMEEFMKGLL